MLYTLSEIKEYLEPLGFRVEAHGGGLDIYRARGDYVGLPTPTLPATLEALKDMVEMQFANADKYLAATGAQT